MTELIIKKMLHSIVGLQNEGKTLVMTYFLFLEFLKGRKVITNYALRFPHTLINRDTLIDFAEKQTSIKNAVFGLDELWIWLDSRKSQENTVATYFFNQSSKENNDIFATAQFNTQNDKRFRDNLHRITQCKRVIHDGSKFKDVLSDVRILNKKQNEKLYIRAEEFKRVNRSYFSEIVLYRTRYVPALPIFSLYDTTERIKK